VAGGPLVFGALRTVVRRGKAFWASRRIPQPRQCLHIPRDRGHDSIADGGQHSAVMADTIPR